MDPLSLSQSNTNWIKLSNNTSAINRENNPQSPLVEARIAEEAANVKTEEKPRLPASLEELMKLQAEAMKDDEEEQAEILRQQMAKQASAEGLPPTGNMISVKA